MTPAHQQAPMRFVVNVESWDDIGITFALVRRAGSADSGVTASDACKQAKQLIDDGAYVSVRNRALGFDYNIQPGASLLDLARSLARSQRPAPKFRITDRRRQA